jgi:hypothetical protein
MNIIEEINQEQAPGNLTKLDIETIHTLVREQHRSSFSVLELNTIVYSNSAEHWFKIWKDSRKYRAPTFTQVIDFLVEGNSTLTPDEKFDIVFIDTHRSKDIMEKTLQAVKKHCIPYLTILCGPGYSTKSGNWIQAITEFVSKEHAIFEPIQNTGFWKIRLTTL